MSQRDATGRPILDAPLRALLTALAEGMAFEAFDASRVLIVAGAARRGANASIRPLTYGGDPPSRVSGRWLKPAITIDGLAMRYEICLRPKFFLALSAEERVHVLAHELWHMAPSFDGTLAADRRHREGGDGGAVEAIVEAWRAAGARDLEVVSHVGEARISAWTDRPPSRIPRDAAMRDAYDARDLHLAIVEFAAPPVAVAREAG